MQNNSLRRREIAKRRKKLAEVAFAIRRQYSIKRRLLAWGGDYYQSFKWRDSPSKFHGLIAELLLQRTTAKAAHRAYIEFSLRYQTPSDLASAQEEEVLTVIRPIGIHSRARMLINLAEQLVTRFRGEIPEKFDDLISLPGVGRYAASAFLTLHANQPVPIADSNVQRVAGRLIGQPVTVDDSVQFFEAILPRKTARAFTLAFLDFAMQICRPNPWVPKCGDCPLGSICATGQKLQKGKNPRWM